MKHYEIYKQHDKQEIDRLVQASPMTQLLTFSEDSVETGYFNPVYLDGKFFLHLNKTDDQFKAMQLRPEAKLLFFDYLCNIPSYWVDLQYGGAATSYYRFAEFNCAVKTFTDLESVARLSQLFLDRFQPEGGYEKLSPNSEIYKKSFAMLGMVELFPIKILAKWKLGQNRPLESRKAIMGKLRQRNQGNDIRTIQEMERWIEKHQ